MHKVQGALMLFFSYTFIMHRFFSKTKKENHQRLLNIVKSLSIFYILVCFLVASFMIEAKYTDIAFQSVYLYLTFSLMGLGLLAIIVFYTNIDQHFIRAYSKVIPFVNIGIIIITLIACTSYFIMRDSVIAQHKMVILITCGLISMSNDYLVKD